MSGYRNIERDYRDFAGHLLEQAEVKGALKEAGFDSFNVEGSEIVLKAGQHVVRLSVGWVGDHYCPDETWIGHAKRQLERAQRNASRRRD